MKFIHCADVHLDSPLRGLEAYEGAPASEIRGATRRAFENLIDLSIEQTVDFVVIAGDLYDGDWTDFNTGLYFTKQMARLDAKGIRAFIVRGNHDADSRITKRLPLPSNVHMFRSSSPETVRMDHLRAAVHGQSFSKADVFDNLSANFPAPVPGFLNVGLLHTALDGREGHSPYAPCTLAELRARGYDYWALGHVHGREVLNEDPWVVFPGNVQGRHVRETGAKGCTLVTVRDGVIQSAEHHTVDVLRWARIDVDISGASSVDDALDLVRRAIALEVHKTGGRPLAARVRVYGPCEAHDAIARDTETWKQHVRSAGIEAGRENVWIEKVETRTSPPRMEPDPGGGLFDLLRSVREAAQDPEIVDVLRTKIDPFLAKLPAELRDPGGVSDIRDKDQFDALVERAAHLLLARLGVEERSS